MIEPPTSSESPRHRLLLLVPLAGLLATPLFVRDQVSPPELQSEAAAALAPPPRLKVFEVQNPDVEGFPPPPFPYYFRNFVSAYGAIHWEWSGSEAGPFFAAGGGLSQLKAGTIVLVQEWQLRPPGVYGGDVRPDAIHRWPRLWALLNHSEPLVVVLDSDGTCSIPWPNTTHHVLYRTCGWDVSQHEQYKASVAAEDGAIPGVWPTIRDLPFGSAFRNPGQDTPTLDVIGGERRPALQRRLLMSFRGSVTYFKPSRDALLSAVQRHKEELDALVASVMDARVPPHPSGVGRYVVDMKMPEPDARVPVVLDADYATSDEISFLELLRESIFSVSPPGDLWEAYRTWESIEAGAIPVVADNSTYHLCSRPALHMLETVPGTIGVASWEALPAVLGRVMSNLTDVAERQRSMLAWYEGHKRDTRRRLLETVDHMRAGSWAPKTTCAITPLSPQQVSAQQDALREYWRQPQPEITTNRWQSWGRDERPRRFVGTPDAFCAEAEEAGNEDWSEICMNEACAPPLIAEFRCSPSVL